MLNRRRFVAGTGAVAAGSALAGCTESEENSDDPTDDDTTDDGGTEEPTDDSDEESEYESRATIMAHRGFAGIYPENTIGAFEEALKGKPDDSADRRSADWIELDVHPTADGDIAVFHDRDLGETTDTDGQVYDLPSEEVFSAEVLGSGETVPSLEESMEAIPADVGVNIDIKVGAEELNWAWGATDPQHYDRDDPHDYDHPEEELEHWEWLQTVVDIADDYDNEILLSTFWEGTLWALENEIDHDYPVAFLMWYSIQEGLDMAEKYDLAALNPPMGMIKDTTMFDEEMYDGETDIDIVAEAHDRDLPVNVYTVDTWHEAEQLIDAGVDGLFPDYSGIFRWGAR
ncbi:glycerophosphoryl diester phosphodiesterase [Halobiforma nitratireducens JCM 10879]|uniref:Glycerophosphoryl diester phosphodiesterase n=1 Tax=Halobiforma nitratireducens JCM 10879 TaxID=1227454 RepID=M0LC72_9EURY|nr:glycerophosphodiester phosphodiesterase family protein [Halobiforma nitratireducens]EMA30014.1 glycerophosphoryl diester phosphodiesterase [Halobiforma nitratireducens JCM 10879]